MIIQNSKTYNVNEVENLFFRPSFCGKSAEELGVRVLYNMPTPTKIPSFGHHNNIIRSFASGWHGDTANDYKETSINLVKLKAENTYSAESYFSTIYEMLINSGDVSLGDLTGTDLEKAETELFRRSIAESIYATRRFGDEDSEISDFTSFPGFLSRIISIKYNNDDAAINIITENTDMDVYSLFSDVWTQAPDSLRAIATDGQLAYFVSSDIYDAYLFWLDSQGLTNVVAGADNVRPTLLFHGIPVVEVPGHKYNRNRANSFCILSDRRNLILALNTADSPEKEIRMWYNPDEMENRHRVVFLANTAIADSELISAYIFDDGATF